ncbi:hypothetical protein K7W42_09815, partial [Deinococcus sp. HMF7604]|uniref:hypothetical protein n=1 Tax=Deinococcus betulae TaxID=2873312 RepID=UPI001CCA652F
MRTVTIRQQDQANSPDGRTSLQDNTDAGSLLLDAALDLAAHCLPVLKKETLREGNALFQACTHDLAWHPAFSKASADVAAEFLKLRATRDRLFWTRMGASGGTLATLALAGVAFYTTDPADWIKSLSLLLVFALGGGLILVGTQVDKVNLTLSTAEALLKAAKAIEPSETRGEPLNVPIGTANWITKTLDRADKGL